MKAACIASEESDRLEKFDVKLFSPGKAVTVNVVPFRVKCSAAGSLTRSVSNEEPVPLTSNYYDDDSPSGLLRLCVGVT